jgi:tetratricopeptide (TPR) repeat protein
MGKRLFLYFICIMMTSVLLCGCSHLSEESKTKSAFKEANDLFNQGGYQASLSSYEQIMEKYPEAADRVLFEMGIVYAHPKNEQKDHQKALESLQKLIRNYPTSRYRQDSEMMIFYINNVTAKDMIIAAQLKQIETLRQEVANKENETTALQKKIEDQERKFMDFAIRNGSADKILIEKKQRRLMLISKGEVLKTYKIALGGNPEGPKIRLGDDKTPEGTYLIDSRNKDSQYHLSLHISYPNERDKKRAKELGVSPGGDIMIHGLKNGFSRIGALHTEVDWTKGCIAVTDDEIDEIGKLTRNGTVVEIRP